MPPVTFPRSVIDGFQDDELQIVLFWSPATEPFNEPIGAIPNRKKGKSCASNGALAHRVWYHSQPRKVIPFAHAPATSALLPAEKS